MPQLSKPAELPRLAGGYGLIIDIHEPLSVRLAGDKTAVLSPGRYVYGGSARGPGGLRARLLRHLKRGKRRHWHVDQLTHIAGVAALWAAVDADECEVVARVLEISGAWLPISGFGSSDCRRCRAHLVALPPGTTIEEIFRRLGKGISWVLPDGAPR